MDEHYDELEIRDPEAREQALFAELPRFLREAMRAPGWARHLDGVAPEAVTSREALGKLPVLRKSDLPALQRETPPFGGLNGTEPGRLARLFMSPGPIFDPEGRGHDWWGTARALHAAGLRKGDVLHNSFSYHLTPAGSMFESGALALGCAVIPAGTGNTEGQVEAMSRYGPRAYAGTPDFLKALLDKAAELGLESSLRIGLVSGAALPPSLRRELANRGLRVQQAYGTADLGLVAYETRALDGMVVNETVILEIVRPGTGDPVPEGEVGEVVVTRLNPDYPMIRLATGDLSAVLAGRSPCGRTNMRIRGWMGRADQTTKVRGMFVHPGQIAEVARRHPEIGRARLVVTRENEADVMSLRVESAAADEGLAARIRETLQSVTKLRGRVELLAPGTLPNDGKVIADERTYG